MTKKISVFDFDGTLADSIPGSIRLVSGLISKHFGIDLTDRQIKKLFSSSSDLSFEEGLKKAFPDQDDRCVKEGIKEFRDGMLEVIAGSEAFPGTKDVLEAFSSNGKVIISSRIEKSLIEGWLKKNNFQSYVYKIFGNSDGMKKEHIEKIRKEFPKSKVVYISDSPGDMSLGDDSIGIRGLLEEEHFPFMKKGASRTVCFIGDLI